LNSFFVKRESVTVSLFWVIGTRALPVIIERQESGIDLQNAGHLPAGRRLMAEEGEKNE
jgi:hypothetical protein